MAAVIESWFRQDLQKPVQVHYLDGSLFSNNGNGNRIGVELTNGGEDYTVTGTVSGYAVLADGSTVPCTGAKSGNKASILVPPAAYLPGNIFITIFLTEGTTVTTLAAVSSTVIQARTDNQVSPGSVVTDWTNTINAAMQSVETAAANLGKIVATPYAQLTFPVPLGKHTYYNNNLYRCTTPIATSEDFTAAHWSSALNLGDEVSDLKSALSNEDITRSFTFTNGYRINYANGKRQSESSGRASGYVNVEGYKNLVLVMRYWKSASEGASGLAFFSTNAEAGYISGVVEPHDNSLEASTYIARRIPVPDNAKYVRVTWWNTSRAEYEETPFICIGEKINVDVSKQEFETKTSEIEVDIQSIKAKYGNEQYDIDISSRFVFTDGYRVNYATGERQESEVSTSASSALVNIEGFKSLIIARRYRSEHYSGASGYAFFTDSSVSSYLSGAPEPSAMYYRPDLGSYVVQRITVPDTAKYFRTTWWKSGTDQASETDFICIAERYNKKNDEELYDAKVGGLLNVKSLANKMLGSDISNLFSFTDGYRINAITGANQTQSSSCTSGYVNIEGYDSILLTQRLLVSGGGASGVAFYSSASVSDFISGQTEPSDSRLESGTFRVSRIKVPSGAKYMRTTWWASNNAHFSEIVFFCIGEKKGWHTASEDQLKALEDQINDGIVTLPDYYYEDGYIDNRVSAIRSIIDSFCDKDDDTKPQVDVLHGGDQFFWFTDPHFYWYSSSSYNAFNGVAMIQYVMARTNIRKVFCGGDIVGGTGMTASTCTNNLRKVKEYLSPLWDNLYMILGNHEWNNPSADPDDNDKMLTIGRIYSMLVKDKEEQFGSVSTQGDYWFDNECEKIRYFCLGTTYTAIISSRQIEWFGSELLKVPDNYTVVILSHVGVNSNGGFHESVSHIIHLMDAAKGKTSYTYNSIVYDFSNFNAEIACLINGHIHFDTDRTTDGGIPVIVTTCDRGPTNTSSEAFNNARPYGTINEQAIDVFMIDTTSKIIKTIRLGGSYGYDDPSQGAPLANPDRVFSYADSE